MTRFMFVRATVFGLYAGTFVSLAIVEVVQTVATITARF